MRCFQSNQIIFSLLAALMLGACTAEQYKATTQEQEMITLGIDLQEGFENDQVEIVINGEEVYRQEKVLTKLLLGYAETMTFKIPKGNSTVTISLPQKMREKTIELDLQQDSYLGISLTPTGLEYIVSDKPFFYQ